MLIEQTDQVVDVELVQLGTGCSVSVGGLVVEHNEVAGLV